MPTVSQITIEMAANISSLRRDMDGAKSTVSGAMDSISGYAATAAKAMLGVSDSMSGTSAALRSLATSAQGLSGLSEQVAALGVGIISLNASVDKQTTGWRANVAALSAATSTVRNGIEIFEKFGSVAPIWMKDFGAAKDKVAELSTGVKSFTQNLVGHNKAASETGPVLQAMRAETELASGGFRAAIPAVGGFVLALGPLLLIAAAVAVVVIAVKVAISALGDMVSGTIPGFSMLAGAMTPFADALKKSAMEAEDFAKKFGSSVTQAATFIGIGERLKISADDGASGMQKLSDAVAESPEKFAALGIAINDSSGKLLPFNQIAVNTQGAIDQYATATDKAGVATHLFAGTAGEVAAAIKLTGPEFEKQQDLLKQYNLLIGTDAIAATKRYTAAQDEFTYHADLTWRSIKETIGAVLMPMLTDLYEKFTGGWPVVAQAFRTGAEYIAQKAYALRQTLLTMADDVAGAWDKLKLRFSSAGEIFSAARSGDIEGVKNAYTKLQTDLGDIDSANRKKAYDREADYQRRLIDLHTSGQGGGVVAAQATKRWKAESDGITDATDKIAGLIKALLALELTKIKVAFEIDDNKIKAQIVELQEQLKKFSTADIAETITELELRQLASFKQTAEKELKIVEDALAELKAKIGDVNDLKKAAIANPENISLITLYVAELDKALKLTVGIAGIEDKRNTILRSGVDVIDAQTRALADGYAKTQASTDDYITGLQRAEEQRALEIALIGKTQLEQDVLKSALQAEFEIRKLNVEITRIQYKLSTEQNDIQRKILNDEIEGIEKKIAARKATEDSVPAALALKKSTTEISDAWKAVESTSVTFFTNLLTNGKSAFSSLWDTIKKFFIDLAAQFATKYVINAVLGMAGAGSSTGMAGSLISSLFGGGGGNVGVTGDGTGGGSTGSLVGSVASTIMGSGGFIGSILGTSGLAAAGTAFTGAMASGVGFLGSLSAGAASLAASGGLLGSAASLMVALGPIGWVALAAGAAYAIFGGKRDPGFKVDNNLTNVGNDASHFTADAISKFDISGRGTDAADKQAMFKPFIDAVQNVDKILAENLLGPDTLAKIRANMNLVNNASSWENLDKAGIEKGTTNFLKQRYGVIFDEVDAKIAATVRGFTGTSEALLQFIGGVVAVMVTLKDNALYFKAVVGTTITVSELQAVAKEGESLAQTLTRVVTVFSATNGVAALMGKDAATAFGAVGLASLAARQNLIDLAGGIQQLDAMSKSYYSHFYSDAERAQLTAKQQNDAIAATFDSLGIATPKSMAAFRALVEAQDLTTVAGRATYAALMKIESSFYAVNIAIENTQAALKDNALYYKSVFGAVISINDLKAIAKEGESLNQTLNRVATVFSVTNGVAATMGKDTATAFGIVGVASLSARQNLIDLAGGIQQLDAMSKSYYDHYYSDAERAAITRKQQNDAIADTFSVLGIAIPKNNAAFRALVEAQDLSTVAGRANYAALIKVEGAFYAVNKAAEATVASLGNISASMAIFIAPQVVRPPFLISNPGNDIANNGFGGPIGRYGETLPFYPNRPGTDTFTSLIPDPRIARQAALDALPPSLQQSINSPQFDVNRDRSIAPAVSAMSPGAGIPVVDQALIKFTQTIRDLESASFKANDAIGRQSNTALYAFNRQSESMQGLIDMSPRAANAFTSVANGMIAMRDATAAFLVQIDTVKTSIGAMFGNTITSLKLSTMTDQEKYAFYQADTERARARSLVSTDPLEIQRLAQQVNSNTLAAQALLSPEQRAQTNPQQIANLEKYNAQIQANLDKQAKAATDANDAFLAKLEGKFNKMNDTQGDISKRNSDAADKQVIAATTTRRFKVDFSANVPGFARTMEVGG